MKEKIEEEVVVKMASPTGSARVPWKSGRRFGGSRRFRVNEPTQDAEPEGGITLFVDGLEDRVTYKQLRRAFEKHGIVEHVFVPRSKKNGRKLRFGFIRFRYRGDGLAAMEKWNRRRMFSSFFTVHPAKYPLRPNRYTRDMGKYSYNRLGKQKFKRQQEWRWREKEEKRGPRLHPRVRKEWRVKEKPPDQHEQSTTWNQVKVSKNSKLSRMAVISLKSTESGVELQNFLKLNGYSDARVLPFGALERTIEFHSEEEFLEFIQKGQGDMESFAEQVRQEEGRDVPKSFLTWIRIWKVPIGFWSADFFAKLVQGIGTMVRLEDRSDGEGYESVRMLMLATDLVLENLSIPITVDGVEMNVLVEVDHGDLRSVADCQKEM